MDTDMCVHVNCTVRTAQMCVHITTMNTIQHKTVLTIFPHIFQTFMILHARTHAFNSIFSKTTWVSWQQKGKPFWILLKQEMVGWQWHQLDHMQIIGTTFQTDNHASTPSLNCLRARCSSWLPTNSCRMLIIILLWRNNDCQTNEYWLL